MPHYFGIYRSIDILIHGPENLLLTLHAADGMTDVVGEYRMVVTNLVDVRPDHKCKCRWCNCEQCQDFVFVSAFFLQTEIAHSLKAYQAKKSAEE